MILDVLVELKSFVGFWKDSLMIVGMDLFRFPPLCIESMLARAFVQNLHFSILFTSQNFSQHPKQHSTMYQYSYVSTSRDVDSFLNPGGLAVV